MGEKFASYCYENDEKKQIFFCLEAKYIKNNLIIKFNFFLKNLQFTVPFKPNSDTCLRDSSSRFDKNAVYVDGKTLTISSVHTCCQ